VRDSSHLPMPPKRHDKIGAGCREHFSVICERKRVPYFGRSFRSETSIGILNSDQLHVRHSDEVAKVSGVVNRMPMAYLGGGNANGHGRPPDRAS
jgi:hypothetical protein